MVKPTGIKIIIDLILDFLFHGTNSLVGKANRHKNHQYPRKHTHILRQVNAKMSAQASTHALTHSTAAALTSNANMEIDHRVVARLCVATFSAIVLSPSFLSPTMKPLMADELVWR